MVINSQCLPGRSRGAMMVLAALGITAAAPARADESAVPARVTAADYPALLERGPFRKVMGFSQTLVLSGVASLPAGKVVTVWDQASGRSFVVTKTPNPQGWQLKSLSESTDLRSVSATIAAGDEELTLRFDPERLAPPKLDNTSKPAPRSEGAVMVEALLRSLDPAAARHFESMAAEEQETFRKSFTEFLSAYPTASDARRLAFVQRTLDGAAGDGAAAPAPEPADGVIVPPSPPPVPVPVPAAPPASPEPALIVPLPPQSAPLPPAPEPAPAPPAQSGEGPP